MTDLTDARRRAWATRRARYGPLGHAPEAYAEPYRRVGAPGVGEVVYSLYLERGEQRSYLDPHYRCGRLGIRKPNRDHPYALAAWEAGHDALKEDPK